MHVQTFVEPAKIRMHETQHTHRARSDRDTTAHKKSTKSTTTDYRDWSSNRTFNQSFSNAMRDLGADEGITFGDAISIRLLDGGREEGTEEWFSAGPKNPKNNNRRLCQEQ